MVYRVLLLLHGGSLVLKVHITVNLKNIYLVLEVVSQYMDQRNRTLATMVLNFDISLFELSKANDRRMQRYRDKNILISDESISV